ncbi:MAG: UDP-N-acetylglucosamine 2-epimerase [Synergistaceae bacterium]|nr:UDP-N-acetylglucosamine 2-epimerase [Synergistaceae bacterium]
MKKICVVTGTRAEYGILYWLLKELSGRKDVKLQIVATGAHLSPEFGLTYRIIEEDGFTIDAKVEMLLSADTASGVTKSAGLALIGFSDAYERLRPDLVIVLGDRYEILAAAIAAYFAGIPTAHIGGGETTEGAIDEAIRHSITKMSCLHFTSAEAYRRRVIQLGEDAESVFNVGALGLEHLRRTRLMDRGELAASLGMELGAINLLVTYHPSTLGESPEEGCAALLSALGGFPGARIVFTYPNSDAGGRSVINMIDNYAGANREGRRAFVSLGQARYLSVLKHFDAVIGNSSSGLIEAPSFKIPTVNIGDRQKGRIRAESVIDCGASAREITAAIGRALSPEFKEVASSCVNPYEKDGTAAAIADALLGYRPPAGGKKFRDLEF